MKYRTGGHVFLLAVLVVTGLSAQDQPSSPGGTDSSQSAPRPVVPQRIRVGGSVAAGMIVQRVTPVYPAEAKAAQVSGTVVLHAIIGKDGAIQKLDLISGPPMLTDSAIDAVRKWRYKPFLLNGQPVEVETTINVAYQLGDAPNPAESSESAKPPSPSPSDVSQEPFVYETIRGAMRFENDGTGSTETRARVRVQNPLGVQHMGQLVFSYNSSNERLEVRTVRVTKPDGRVIVAGPDAVQDLTAPVAQMAPVYTDARQKHVTVPGLSTGDILEYDVVKTLFQPLTPGQFWDVWDFVNDGYCLDEQVDLDVPRDRALKMKNPSVIEPTMKEEGDRRIYHWKTSNASSFGSNRVMPTLNGFNPTAILEGARQPAPRRMLFSTFQSWGEVGQWYAGLERDRRVATPDLRAKADELVRGAKTDSEKAAPIYDFVSRNIRYVSLSFGVGRYQPHAAAEIFANEYGDCKDKATLLGTLLDLEGVRNSTVLINTQADVDPDVPTPQQFDHAILVASVNGHDVWLDSTLGVGPYAYLLPQLRAKNALVVASEGFSEIRETPATLLNPRLYRISVEGNKAADKIDMLLSFDIQGDDLEVMFRAALLRVPAATLAQSMNQGARSVGGGDATFSDVKASDPFDIQNPFHLEAHLSGMVAKSSAPAPNAATEIPTLAGLPADSEWLSYILPNAPQGSDAKEAVLLGGPKEMFLHVKATSSSATPIISAKPIHITTDFAEYEISESLNGDTRTTDIHLGLKIRELPAGRAAEYADFRTKVIDSFRNASADKPAVAVAPVPVPAPNPAPSASKLPSTPASSELKPVYDNALKALNSGNPSSAAELLEVVVARDPNFKGAWNDLGRAYTNLREYDKAIPALRTAIEKDPGDPYAYNNLGLVFLRQKRYDDAIPQFQRQIKITSNDRYAHANLGIAYLQTRKFAEAARELDRAAAISPQDAAVQINLGRAYAGSAQPEKATQAFDRAVTLTPLPAMFNDAAFFMADNNLALDRAETYAKSAVRPVEDEIGNVSVDRAVPRDLANVASLAAFWDTMGWVKFRQDDSASAEKYLLAAWQLSDSGVMGDHLGQVYEKEGRRANAIRTYELALATSRAPAETRERLAALLGGDQTIDSVVESVRPTLPARRTARIANPQRKDGSAQLMILISRAPNSSTVRFISGDDSLRSMSNKIGSARFPDLFPDDTAQKILRRGQLSCSHLSGTCSLVFTPADSTDFTY
jgi:TonB family protein